MTVDRKQVEAVALTVEMHPNGMRWTMPAEVLAELCRAWLALDAAPEVQIGGADGLSAFLINRGKKSLPAMQGQTVRLVPETTGARMRGVG